MSPLFRTILFFLIAFALSATAVLSQATDFQVANQLMQQQKYEEALPILENLYQNNPNSLIFFDQYTDCLVNLTMYEEAEAVARKQMEYERFRPQATIKLAEILHISGDRDGAMEIWLSESENDQNSIQHYYTIGSSLLSRQEFDTAIELFRLGQKRLNNPNLFTNELADTYMQAGRFEEAVIEFFQLIKNSPDQMSLVQQRFFMMRDREVYEIAAFELEDLLLDMHHTDSAYSPLYQLLAWLLLETEQYQRAFQFARHYENQTSFTIYSLFSLAGQFVSAREFELAVQAYEYYLNDGIESIRSRAGEELSAAYIQWVRYLQQNNLGSELQYRDLYLKAYDLSTRLINSDPNYNRAGRVFAQIIDLNVDFFKDPETAKEWFNRMREHEAQLDEAYLYYAEGRIALFNKDFTTARHTFTRADRLTDDSNLSERSRYYLSLSDFFGGDYDFAEIQLRSLERRSTSFYANDAIKLRMWIKNGLRADTTKSILDTISESMFHLHTGSYNEALQKLEPIMSNRQNPFAADLLTEMISELPESYYPMLLQLSERVISAQPNSPKSERLRWDRASLIEQILKSDNTTARSPFTFSFLDEDPVFQYSEHDLQQFYEDFLMEYPNGFYAVFAREKLQNLEDILTPI